MTKSKLRKIAIVLSALAVLSGGFGIDTAYARGGGHLSGGFRGGHIGGEFGGGLMGGAGIANLRGNPLGTEHIGARTDNHVGALAGVHAAPFGRLRDRRTPAVLWGAAPWYNTYDAPRDSGSDAAWDSGFDAPPWYGGSDAPWYGGSGLTWYAGVENPTYAVPGRDPSDTTNRNVTCRTQTYQVRSAEDGGERAVNIVRC